MIKSVQFGNLYINICIYDVKKQVKKERKVWNSLADTLRVEFQKKAFTYLFVWYLVFSFACPRSLAFLYIVNLRWKLEKTFWTYCRFDVYHCISKNKRLKTWKFTKIRNKKRILLLQIRYIFLKKDFVLIFHL